MPSGAKPQETKASRIQPRVYAPLGSTAIGCSLTFCGRGSLAEAGIFSSAVISMAVISIIAFGAAGEGQDKAINLTSQGNWLQKKGITSNGCREWQRSSARLHSTFLFCPWRAEEDTTKGLVLVTARAPSR